MTRPASVERASIFLLALALAGLGGERVAEACNGIGPNCFNPTPVCAPTGLGGTCVACSATAPCPGVFGSTLTCQADGSCTASCTADYDGGSASTNCPVDYPACVAKTCMQCVPRTTNDHHCPANEPDCNASGQCGCQTNDDCPLRTHCDGVAGPLGQGECVSTCSSDNACTTRAQPFCVVGGARDLDGSANGECVECVGALGCSSSGTCSPTTNTCEPQVSAADAGEDAGDASGGGSGGDGGTTIATGDSGVTDAGGASTRDATVGGDGGEDTDDRGAAVYPDGKVEGGGCSLLAGGTPSAPLLSSFAGIAGLLFLRRAQRRSVRRRHERR